MNTAPFKLLYLLGLALLAIGCSSSNLYHFKNSGSQVASHSNIPSKITSDSANSLKAVKADINVLQASELVLLKPELNQHQAQKNNFQIPAATGRNFSVIKFKKQDQVKITKEKRPTDPPWGALFLAAITIFLLTLLLLTGLVFLFIFIAETWGILVLFGSLIAIGLLIRFGFPFLLKIATILLHVFLDIFVKQGVR